MAKRSSHSNVDTQPPRRSLTHRIDTDAVRVVRTKLTSDWLERSVEDRDYGIDMMLEEFEGEDPTGTLLLFQIKGRMDAFGEGEISLDVPVKTLLYAKMFQAPFFLVYVSVEDKRAYFIWLQKYIDIKLAEDKRWRKQQTIKVYFPEDNELNEMGLDKIGSLVKYVVHRDLGILFLKHLAFFSDHHQEFCVARKSRHCLSEMIRELKEIKKLGVFLDARLSDGPAESDVDIDEMLKILRNAEVYGEFEEEAEKTFEKYVTNLHVVARLFLTQDESDAILAESFGTSLPY
jgi:hypothetical protein